jgi:hypothetical protein
MDSSGTGLVSCSFQLHQIIFSSFKIASCRRDQEVQTRNGGVPFDNMEVVMKSLSKVKCPSYQWSKWQILRIRT